MTENLQKVLDIIDDNDLYDEAACVVGDHDWTHELSETGFHHGMRDYIMERVEEELDIELREFLTKSELKELVRTIEEECEGWGDFSDDDPYGDYDFEDDDEEEDEYEEED